MAFSNLTLLAIIALSVSNLFVGISTGNTALVMASALISAALAGYYLFKIRKQAGAGRQQEPGATALPQNTIARAQFPFWAFLIILFMVLPGLYWFIHFAAR